MSRYRGNAGWALLVSGALVTAAAAQSKPSEIKPVEGIIPSGFGESVDRDVARARAATVRFKLAENAIAAGYPAASNCVANPPQGGMGYHFQNESLLDTKLDVEKPEILVYEKMANGSFKLNGVEYIVPIDAWKKDEAPTIMGQKLKRADRLGIWYLHVWIWEPSPPGIFADWNPRVKC
jgi:hypothetical protein